MIVGTVTDKEEEVNSINVIDILTKIIDRVSNPTLD